MSGDPGGRPRPQTTLNAFDIACVVIGGIIGIGIFFAPAKVAKVVSSKEQVVAVWAIGGAMVLFGAFVYARLGQLAPGHGGQFEYIRRAFGRLPAFLYGWCNMLAVQSGAIAIVGLVMASYLEQLLGVVFSPVQKVWIAAGAIALLTGVNGVGLIVGKSVQVVLTVVKTGAVFGIVLIAMLADPVPAAVAEPPRPEVGFFAAMSAAILPVLFAAGGWQHGSFVAAVARRPLRDVPLGIVGGVVVVVVAYLLINLAYVDLLGLSRAAKSETITVDAVRAAVGGEGEWVARGFAGLVVISALGVMNTICMAPPYVLHAMAERGLFFPAVGRLHARFRTPLLAMVTQGLWAITLLWVTQALTFWLNQGITDPLRRRDALGFLLDGVVFVDWLFYGTCGAALLVLLRGAPQPSRLDPLYRVAAVLFALSALAVTVGAIVRSPAPTFAGLAVLGVGLVAYLGFRREKPGPDWQPEPPHR